MKMIKGWMNARERMWSSNILIYHEQTPNMSVQNRKSWMELNAYLFLCLVDGLWWYVSVIFCVYHLFPWDIYRKLKPFGCPFLVTN